MAAEPIVYDDYDNDIWPSMLITAKLKFISYPVSHITVFSIYNMCGPHDLDI